MSIYHLEGCALSRSLINAAEWLHRSSHLSVPLAITEAIRICKPELNEFLIRDKSEENRDDKRKKVKKLTVIPLGLESSGSHLSPWRRP